jgi:hypothetical protein
MTIISTHPSVTFPAICLSSPIKDKTGLDFKKTRPNCLLPAKNAPIGKDRHILKVKGWKKNIPSKWKLKASKNSYSHI